MFVGRQSELESLETAYQKGSFQFAVVYGRRRVGKTSLLRADSAKQAKMRSRPVCAAAEMLLPRKYGCKKSLKNVD